MDAKTIMSRHKALTTSPEFLNHQTLSEDTASLFLPRRADIQTKKTTGSEAGWYDHILDSTPINAAQILATGQFDLLFSGEWFQAQSPSPEPEHAELVAYEIVGERMFDVLKSSNFELAIQEFLLDRSALHTAVALIEADDEDTIYCTHIPASEYAIAENYKKKVDTLSREFKLSARQAAQKFSNDDDKLGEKLQKAAKSENEQDKQFTFIHQIYPRKNAKPGSQGKKNKPWASVYVCKEDQMIVRESGYDEQPFMCSRYDRWGGSPYGTGPAHIELSTARGLQKMRETLIALGDRVVSPGVFVSERQEGQIEPFGITVVSDQDASLGLPREWQSNARYDVGKDVVEDERRRLNESFLVPLFKLLTSEHEQNREKTAYEVSKMLDEQIGRAAPTFKRLQVEVLEPILMRVFSIMLRKGMFNDILPDMVARDEKGEVLGVQTPKINFTSKLALAFKAVKSNAMVAFQSVTMPMLQLKPDLLDNLDMDTTFRRQWIDLGLPAVELRDPKIRDRQRQERMQMQMAAAAAEAAPKLGQAAKSFSEVQ